MKSNQKGFTALEILLIVVIVGVLGGAIGYVVSNIRHKTDNKNNVATQSKTQSATSQDAGKKPSIPDTIDYKERVRITTKADVTKLVGATDSFKAFIAGKMTDKEQFSEGCENPYTITVSKIYKDQFANGGEGQCGGAAIIWKNENGSWIQVFGGQVALPCDTANKYKIPAAVSEKCQDENVKADYGIIDNPN